MQDVDIDLVGDFLTKLAKVFSDLPVLVAVAALLFALPRKMPGFGRARVRPAIAASPPRIRPPLRAPPF